MQRHDGCGGEVQVDGTLELHARRVPVGEIARERRGEDDREVTLDVDVVRRQHDRRLGP